LKQKKIEAAKQAAFEKLRERRAKEKENATKEAENG